MRCSVFAARSRLASLWVSQVARVLADWCLWLVAFLEVAGTARQGSRFAWHLSTAVFITPFLLLAPLNGPLCNGFPRRGVLAGSALCILLAVGCFIYLDGPWIICLGVVALGAAVYSPARYALLPAAARDTHLPLPRVNGWVEMGGAGATLGGIALGCWLVPPGWPDASPLGSSVLLTLLGLNGLCLFTALPVDFPSDVIRREPPGRALVGFFSDTRRIFRDRVARGSVLALASFQALVTAGSGALLAQALGPGEVSAPSLLSALLLIGVGAGLGCWVAGFNAHPRRNLGYVTLGATGLVLALWWAGWRAQPGQPLPLLPCTLLGFSGGLVNAPLRAAYLAAVPADARGNATAIMNTTIYLLTTILALILVGLISAAMLSTPLAQLVFLGVVAGLGCLLAWRVLFVHTVELFLEWVLSPLYRIRATGPGAEDIPRQGPLILIANHTSWFDPFWLGKIIPRKFTPMMTSLFYDLPIVRFCMKHIVGAIRVPEVYYRREAPELQEALAVLRAGGCLLLFPEARLRRREEPLIQPFRRGVWHLLSELPETPVVLCWIEGGWGSFLSWCNGPPMKNKRLDWARPIRIAVTEPRVLKGEILQDHRTTRSYLTRACLESRRFLGLDVPPETPQPGQEEEAENHG
jgi:1-acyl-sn-glycerol-3-phosphate acyltransferase/MFS family permease